MVGEPVKGVGRPGDMILHATCNYLLRQKMSDVGIDMGDGIQGMIVSGKENLFGFGDKSFDVLVRGKRIDGILRSQIRRLM